MIDLREAKKEDLELLYSMQLKAFAALFEKYQDKETSPAAEPFERTLQRFSKCAGHGTVLAGESPVMDNLPSM